MRCLGVARSLAAAALLTLAFPTAPLPAQVVRGTVVELADGRPVASVTMLVSRVGRGVNHRSVTDSAGRFRLRPYPRGEYQISIEWRGRRSDVGPPMGVMREDTFTVVVRVPREGSAPPELTVVSDTRSRRLEAVGFYRRSTSGAGAQIGPALIRARNWLTTGRLLSHPRVRAQAGLRTPFRGGWSTCRTLFVDGQRYGLAYRDVMDRVTPDDIEGIEIYPTYWGTPPEFATKGSNCGAIVIWLRG